MSSCRRRCQRIVRDPWLIALLAVVSLATAAHGQTGVSAAATSPYDGVPELVLIERLPPIDATAIPGHYDPAANPAKLDPKDQPAAFYGSQQPYLGDPNYSFIDPPPAVQTSPEPQPKKPVGKEGMLQNLWHSTTYMGRGSGSHGMGMTDLDFSMLLGLPLMTRETPLLLTPGYLLHLTDGPTFTDVPAELHEAYMEIRHIRPIMAGWTIDIAASPGAYGDFQGHNSHVFRMPGRAVLIYDWSESAKLLLGIAYYDRPDISFLPVAGWIWNYSDDFRVEIIMPRPRLTWRMATTGKWEHWTYVLGEFGGGAWAIQRTDGTEDMLMIQDYRLSFGYERKADTFLKQRIEAGYVFGRKLHYRSDEVFQHIDPTWIIRGTLSF